MALDQNQRIWQAIFRRDAFDWEIPYIIELLRKLESVSIDLS